MNFNPKNRRYTCLIIGVIAVIIVAVVAMVVSAGIALGTAFADVLIAVVGL